jgi:integrase
MNSMSTQGLLERSNGYYFQARIPKQYLPHYPKQIIREKLPTENRKEAIAIVRKRWAELQAEFERIVLTSTKFKTTITPSEIEHIIKLVLHSKLSADDEIRGIGVDDDTFSRLEEYVNEADTSEKLVVSRGQLTPLSIDIASDWLISHDYDISQDSKQFRDFAIQLSKAQIEATKAIKLRQLGIPSETPSAPPPLNTQVNTHGSEWDSLDKLREYWLSQPAKSGNAKKSRTAEAEAITIIKKFRKLVGDLKPSEITRSHIGDLKDKMLAEGSAPATINKGRGILAAIFSTAENNGKLDKNPFLGMTKLSIPEKEVESPYTILELQTIFNSPVFTEGYRPKKLSGGSAYWLPLLSLYSGARLNELGQLYTGDISNEDGIDYYLIKPDLATGRTVKDNKRRRVPIHPDLIKMGFLEYVVKIKSEGHLQLFPELKITSEDRKLADNWAEGWRDYVRVELGLTKIPQPFHAFRHSYIEHGRRSKMDSELRRLIEGHAVNTVEMKSYGGKLYPLAPLHDELKKLNFKGLDLSHLYVTSNELP